MFVRKLIALFLHVSTIIIMGPMKGNELFGNGYTDAYFFRSTVEDACKCISTSLFLSLVESTLFLRNVRHNAQYYLKTIKSCAYVLGMRRNVLFRHRCADACFLWSAVVMPSSIF